LGQLALFNEPSGGAECLGCGELRDREDTWMTVPKSRRFSITAEDLEQQLVVSNFPPAVEAATRSAVGSLMVGRLKWR
jgi:hypothetical protein